MKNLLDLRDLDILMSDLPLKDIALFLGFLRAKTAGGL